MPFYLRKSFRLGPLRINLSKSGLGASTGVKGLRVGTGPKGRYLHAGRHGLYFRKQLGSGASDHADLPDAPVEEAAPKDGLMRWIKGLLRGR